MSGFIGRQTPPRKPRLESLCERRVLASISGSVFVDSDWSGDRNDSDQPVHQAIVWIDSNGDARLDDGDLTALSDTQGNYRFNDLPAGRHEVRYLPTPNLHQISPSRYLTWRGDADNVTLVGINLTDGSLEAYSEHTLVNRQSIIKTNEDRYFGAGSWIDTIIEIRPDSGDEVEYDTTNYQFGGGLAYDSLMDRIYTYAAPNGSFAKQLLEIDRDTGEPTPVGVPAENSEGLFFSALTFDWRQRKIYSFELNSKTLYATSLDGSIEQLATFEHPFYNLSFDGTRLLGIRYDESGPAVFELDAAAGELTRITTVDGRMTTNAAEIVSAYEPHIVQLEEDSVVDDLLFLAGKVDVPDTQVTILDDSIRFESDALYFDQLYPIPDGASPGGFCSPDGQLHLIVDSNRSDIDIPLTNGDDVVELTSVVHGSFIDAGPGWDRLSPLGSFAFNPVIEANHIRGIDEIDLVDEFQTSLAVDAAILDIATGDTLLISTDSKDTVDFDSEEDWQLSGPQVGRNSERNHQFTFDSRTVLLNDGLGWQNPFEAMDVNHDSVITPLDALIIINLLNAGLSSELSVDEPRFANADYVDASGDNILSALDALLVINSLA
ncbi:MAG: dockerin type I domain-containing protein [Aureliella sp.]